MSNEFDRTNLLAISVTINYTLKYLIMSKYSSEFFPLVSNPNEFDLHMRSSVRCKIYTRGKFTSCNPDFIP